MRAFQRLRSTTPRSAYRRNYTTPTQPSTPPPLPKSEFTRQLTSKGFFKTAASLLTLGAVTTSLLFYITEWHQTPEKSINYAIQLLSDPSISTKKEALELLSTSGAYITKRVFSGKVDIPTASPSLLNPHLLSLLTQCFQGTDDELEVKAASRLLDITRVPGGADLFSRNADDILHLLNFLKYADHANTSSWLLVASLFLHTSHVLREGGIHNAPALKSAIETLAESSYPLARLVGEEMKCKLLASVSPSTSRETACKAAMAHEEKVDAGFQGASITSLLGISLIAAGWGKMMWRTRFFSVAQRKFARHTHTIHYQNWKHKFLSSRRVGTAVFVLMALDLIATQFLRCASTRDLSVDLDRAKEGIDLPNLLSFAMKAKHEDLERQNVVTLFSDPKWENMRNYLTPMSSFYPAVQTTMFGLGTLALISRQRYVVFPLLLATAYNHRDLWKDNPQIRFILQVGEEKLKETKETIKYEYRDLTK